MESVTVHYKLSEKEFLAACRVLTLSGAGAKLRLILSPALWFVGMILLFLAFGYELPSALLFGVSMLAVLAALFYYTLVELPRRSFRGDRKFRDGVTFTFSDEGIFAQTKLVESKMDWKLYTDVLEGEDCYVLVYGKDIRMLTPVPKRAFKSRKQEQAFRALVFPRFDRKLEGHQTDERELSEDDYKPAGLEPPDWR